MVYLSAADILIGKMTKLLHGVIYRKSPLLYRIENYFKFFMIHEIVPAASNKLVPLYHAYDSFPCKNLIYGRYYAIKKMFTGLLFTGSYATSLRILKHARVKKWVKQLQKKYLMLTW